MNVFTSLAAAFRELSALKNLKPRVTHNNSAEGSLDKILFGPKTPVGNDELLSLEDELERELYEIAKRINRAFHFSLLPSKGAPQARWLAAHIDEVAAWNPGLAAEAEQVAMDITKEIDETLDRLHCQHEATPAQSERLVERLAPVQASVSIADCARLLNQYFGAEFTPQDMRRAAAKFGTNGKRDGVVQVRLDKAIAHFDKEFKK